MNENRSSEEKTDWIEEIQSRFRDGIATEEEIDALRELLLTDREARIIYLESNQLDALLETAAQTDASLPSREADKRFPKPLLFIGGAAATAIAAAVVLLLTLLPPDTESREAGVVATHDEDDSPVATLQSVHGTTIGGKRGEEGLSFGRGAFVLDQGIAQLLFRNGTTIVIEGDSALEIIDENSLVLSHGKIWASCPQAAPGFRVLTPGGMEVIDMGSEFGVKVTPAAVLDVHVFEGAVDVRTSDADPASLAAGDATRWSPGSAPEDLGGATQEDFVTSADLADLRYTDYRKAVTALEGLLLYYDFTGAPNGELRNMAPGALPETHGEITGALELSGRFPGKSGLLFDQAGDSVSFRLDNILMPKRTVTVGSAEEVSSRPQEAIASPGDSKKGRMTKSKPPGGGLILTVSEPVDPKGMTIAMWVRPDRFAQRITALLNSNGWDPGDIHLQVTADGSLRCGINGMGVFLTPADTVIPGKWQHLAVAWDLKAATARFVIDGEPVVGTALDSMTPTLTGAEVRFGGTRVGSWGEPIQSPSRDFRGRIDEILILDRSLSNSEITSLYLKGKP